MSSRGVRWLVSDFAYRDEEKRKLFERSKAEVLNSYKEYISMGTPLEKISELGGLDRQLLQAPEFYTSGNVILKKVTPDEELDEAENLAWIPEGLRDIMLSMEMAEINPGPLRQAILHTREDPDALGFILEHFREWDESRKEDALEVSEFGLDTTEAEPNNDEDQGLTLEYEEDSSGSLAFRCKVLKTFSPPKDRYRVVERARPNENKEAAERRIDSLKGDLDQLKELWTVESIEDQLDKLRVDYEHDTNLLLQWSPSAKKLDRALYLQFMRARGLDEETKRAKLWACFDREPELKVECTEKVRPVKFGWVEGYDGETHKVEEECLMSDEEIASLQDRIGRDPTELETLTSRVLPCIWEIERSKALRELNHTKAQWEKVYRLAWERLGQAILLRARNARSLEILLATRKSFARWQSRIPDSFVKKIPAVLRSRELELRSAGTCSPVVEA